MDKIGSVPGIHQLRDVGGEGVQQVSSGGFASCYGTTVIRKGAVDALLALISEVRVISLLYPEAAEG